MASVVRLSFSFRRLLSSRTAESRVRLRTRKRVCAYAPSIRLHSVTAVVLQPAFPAIQCFSLRNSNSAVICSRRAESVANSHHVSTFHLQASTSFRLTAWISQKPPVGLFTSKLLIVHCPFVRKNLTSSSVAVCNHSTLWVPKRCYFCSFFHLLSRERSTWLLARCRW